MDSIINKQNDFKDMLIVYFGNNNKKKKGGGYWNSRKS